MNRQLARRVALAVLCGAIGLGLNSLPAAAVAPLLLGRVVTLPIAILFGPSLGIVAAIVGALVFLPLPGTGLVIVGFLAIEGALTGAFAVRGRSSLVAGALFWTGAALLL